MRTWQGRSLVDHLPFVLLIVAAAFFLIRGPVRGLDRAYDLSWNYLGTRAWLNGLNPYDLSASLAMRGPEYAGFRDLQGFATPYFPAVFPITAPFAGFDWPEAVALFLAALLALIALLLWRACAQGAAIAGARLGLTALSLFLIMYPLHTGVSLLQYSIAASICSLLVLTFDLERPWPSAAAAVFTALALAFKPQVGIVVMLYGLALWRLRFLIGASVLYGLLSAIGAWPIIEVAGFAWIEQIRANVAFVSVQQQDIYCCVNLRPVLEPVMTDTLAVVLALGPVTAAAGVLGWTRLVQGRSWSEPEERLTLFLVLAAAVLLSMYTRPYNVVLLAPALLLYPHLRRSGLRGATIALYGALAIFLQPVPVQGVFNVFVGEAYQQWPGVAQTVWRFLVAPMPTYALLVVFLTLCVIMVSPAAATARAPLPVRAGGGRRLLGRAP